MVRSPYARASVLQYPALASLLSGIPQTMCLGAFSDSSVRQSEYVTPLDTCQP